MPYEQKVLRNIKLTEDENHQLKMDAYAHGMNVSEYIRWLVAREREAKHEEKKGGGGLTSEMVI